MSGSLSAIHEIAGRIDELMAVDAAALPVDAQVEQLEELFVLDAKLTALTARRVQAASDTDATVAVCGRATKSFLVEELRLDPGTAGKAQRLGRGLQFARLTDQALAAGDINDGHALVILKVLRHVRDDELRAVVEQELVKLSLDHPPFVVARAVDQILVLLGVEASAQDANDRRFGQRGVGLDETIGGTGSLNGTLTPELREKLQTYFAAAAGKLGPEDDRTARQRQHDALGELVDFGLTHMDSTSPVGGERPRIVITMTLDQLLGDVPNGWAMLDSGAPISPETARRLACDADVVPAVLGSRGEILDLGRSSRTFSTAIRRAAKVRDGGRCAFPRCTRPPRELHHIIWFSKGGSSSLDNAAWLCAFHHRLVHEGGWRLARLSDGRYCFTAPTGVEFKEPRHTGAA